jgi:phosphonate transport system substrate-binding protein
MKMFNALHFFSDSGSHLNSIQMVASRKADVASVDSNVLGYAMAKSPSLAKDLHVFNSIGPLSPYPIMVRSSLPAEEKKAICDALLQLEGVAPWNKRCADLRLLRFVKINTDIYLEDRESRDSLANLSASVRYY